MKQSGLSIIFLRNRLRLIRTTFIASVTSAFLILSAWNAMAVGSFAVGYDVPGGRLWYAITANHRSTEAADSAARQACLQQGPRCSIGTHDRFINTCFAVATTTTGNGWYPVLHDDLEKAKSDAVAACQKHFGTKCVLGKSLCDSTSNPDDWLQQTDSHAEIPFAAKCSRENVRHFFDPSVTQYWALAYHDENEIRYGPVYFQIPYYMKHFISWHECGHIDLATTDEFEANCYALENGGFSRYLLRLIKEHFYSIPRLADVHGGSGRAFWDKSIERCPKFRV